MRTEREVAGGVSYGRHSTTSRQDAQTAKSCAQLNYTTPGIRQVKPERLGHRDLLLSARHRTWGIDCPATDIDLLMVQYDRAIPTALIEFKHKNVGQPNLDNSSIRALANLADRAGLPFAVIVYDPQEWTFRAYPVNDLGREWFAWAEELSEVDFVGRLYSMRDRRLPDELAARLNGGGLR